VSVDRNSGTIATIVMHTKLGELLGSGVFRLDVIKSCRANRKRLRLIIQGDVRVEFMHRLIYIKEESGGVIENLENVVKVRGDYLIAADGLHSFGKVS